MSWLRTGDEPEYRTHLSRGIERCDRNSVIGFEILDRTGLDRLEMGMREVTSDPGRPANERARLSRIARPPRNR
jgi:hypothetical protein